MKMSKVWFERAMEEMEGGRKGGRKEGRKEGRTEEREEERKGCCYRKVVLWAADLVHVMAG